MSRRRLSIQQQRRVDEQRSLQDADLTAIEQCNGRVISHFGQHLDVEDLADPSGATVVRCHQRANLPALVTGDLVQWQFAEENQGVVNALAQRRNVFSRPDYQGRQRPVAANLDIVQVVIAGLPEPFMNLIDRYLVAIENLGLRAALVLNKIDLPESQTRDIDTMLSLYEGLGYPIFRVSAQSSHGIEALNQYLEKQTTVLVGQSGVGKSSLINCLAGSDQAQVGDLSVGKDKGTHTTTTARLFHLPHCDLIDSPGIREYKLEPLSATEVCYGFVEFRPFSDACKFRNCRHQGDPGCAIQDAVDEGKIDSRRWESFQRILAGADS